MLYFRNESNKNYCQASVAFFREEFIHKPAQYLYFGFGKRMTLPSGQSLAVQKNSNTNH
jgi:hypothetical protein